MEPSPKKTTDNNVPVDTINTPDKVNSLQPENLSVNSNVPEIQSEQTNITENISAQTNNINSNNGQPSTQPTTSSNRTSSNIGLLILQWLTYAFWGWAILALSALIASAVAFYINDTDTSQFSPYGIAALLTLLPIAVVCEIIYRKKEPIEKKGAEVAIGAIHAVIFALIGVGSLITAVISLVTMFTSSGDNTNSLVVLISAVIIAFIYALTFLRTINIKSFPRYGTLFRILMISISVITIIMSIVGPVARQRETRTDRLIESNLDEVNRAIGIYSKANKRLPEKLTDLDLEGDAKKLVDENLITYKNEGYTSVTKNGTASNFNDLYSLNKTSYTYSYRYQLCVTYKRESAFYKKADTYFNDSEYSTYLSSYSHPAGEVCYKLMSSSY